MTADYDPLFICLYSVPRDPRKSLGPEAWVVATGDLEEAYMTYQEAWQRFLSVTRLAGCAVLRRRRS